jgi:hypothetical protein
MTDDLVTGRQVANSLWFALWRHGAVTASNTTNATTTLRFVTSYVFRVFVSKALGLQVSKMYPIRRFSPKGNETRLRSVHSRRVNYEASAKGSDCKHVMHQAFRGNLTGGGTYFHPAVAAAAAAAVVVRRRRITSRDERKDLQNKTVIQ